MERKLIFFYLIKNVAHFARKVISQNETFCGFSNIVHSHHFLLGFKKNDLSFPIRRGSCRSCQNANCARMHSKKSGAFKMKGRSWVLFFQCRALSIFSARAAGLP